MRKNVASLLLDFDDGDASFNSRDTNNLSIPPKSFFESNEQYYKRVGDLIAQHVMAQFYAEVAKQKAAASAK